jgi:tetratricopeptide (TPR) repeat protein
MKLPHAVSLLVILGSCAIPLAAGMSGCAGYVAPGAAAVAGSAPARPVQPAAPAPAPMTTGERVSLLNQSFDIASLIPPEPHAKDRAKAQEAVALACLDLGMVEQADYLARRIDGWRRGEALGLAGQRYAAAGNADAARRCAMQAAEAAGGDDSWTGERVMSLVAGTYARLGDEQAAARALAGVSQRALGSYEAARAPVVKDAELDGLAASFDRAFALQDLDFARGAFEGYCALLDRVQSDAPRRERALRSIDASIKGFPLDLQVTNLCRVADWLSAHGDAAGARERIDLAAAVLAATTFQAEDVVPLGMSVARSRMRAGDAAAARADIERLRGAYDAKVEYIVDLRRGMSLRALAEGWAMLGERDAALRCWAEALEAGVLNPNSRPRAEDLGATVLSMAVAGVAPTPAMRARIDAIRSGLADPW